MLMRSSPSVTVDSTGQEIAAAVLEDLKDPNRGIQGSGHTSNGQRCLLISAYLQVGWDKMSQSTPQQDAAVARFRHSLGFETNWQVVEFNDSYRTAHADVIARLQKAL